MKKQILTKIISGLIVFVFVVSMFQFALPAQAANSMANFYSNPNQANNTYKFKIKDVVNSNLLTNIVGCTGVVNKVATWMSTMIQSPAKIAEIAADEIANYRNQAKQACLMVKGAAQISGNSLPLVGGIEKGLSTFMEAADIVGGIGSIGVKSIKTTPPDTKALAGVKPAEPAGLSPTEKSCVDNVNVMSDDIVKKLATIQKQDQADNFKTQCFDGIAITLAKNQLSAMTRSAMNWVNSGYGGNPFFVQNMTNLTNNIERNVLNTGIDALLSPLAPQNPYASDFMTSMIKTQGLRSSSTKFLGGLTSDLENFISNPVSYYSDKTLTDAERAQVALQRSRDANNAFARDFSVGGWNGWLALTQTPQNNPLGFNMITSQYLADVQSQEVSRTQSELTQNNGFLNQKECIKWQIYNADGTPKKKPLAGAINKFQYDFVYSTTEPGPKKPTDGYGECTPDGWKVTTPGSIIRDKTTNYLNSPERQLELAKTINDSLNALFSVLIDKLAGGGLSSLSDSANNSSNWIDTMNNYVSPDGNTPYNNNGAYDGFNLTRDLGNNYIYSDPTYLGTWNAKTCPPLPGDQTNCNEATNETYKELPSTFPAGVKTVKLYPETPPENYEIIKDGTIKLTKDSIGNDQYGELANPINAYYKVETAGNTKLMVEGYNGWAVGDRAFWDGSQWQNWKCYKPETDPKTGACNNQINPIKKRGVIQTQQDYIVAAKEILKVLPSVMPKLGELDYCLPGPNPSYQNNSMDAQSAYQSWIGSMFVGPLDEYRIEWRIDHEGTRTYNNWANIFNDNPHTRSHLLGLKDGPTINSDGVVTALGGPMSLLTGFDINWVMTADKSRTWVGDALKSLFGGKNNEKGSCVSGGGSPGSCQSYHYKPASSGAEQENIDNRKQLMNGVLDYVNNYLFQDFYNVFDKKMNELYFKKMTSKYNDTELIIGQAKNDAYVEMASAGLDLTKNIIYYNDDIANATSGYVDAMTQAKINISKLEPIRDEVSKIIKDAQDRRDKDLIKQFVDRAGVDIKTKDCETKYQTDIDLVKTKCEKGNNDCLSLHATNPDYCAPYLKDCNKISVPPKIESEKTACLNSIDAQSKKDIDTKYAAYKITYASCLAEENISFYDPEQIMGNTESGNCNDEIDNDLNGLVDCKDIACKDSSFCKSTTTTENTIHCVSSGTTFIINQGQGQLEAMSIGCNNKTTETACTNSYEEDETNVGTVYYQCAWN